MSRFAGVLFGFVVGVLPVAAADPPAGSWKLTMTLNNQPVIVLVAFSQADGKWVGDVVDATVQFNKEPVFESVTVRAPNLQFRMTVDKQPFLTFDGVLTADGKTIKGSYSLGGGPLQLTELKPSGLKRLTDAFELMRETIAQTDEPQAVYDASLVVLGQATAKKLKPDEVRSLVDRAGKLSGGYGPRWERAAAVRFAGVLTDQPGFEEVALAQARKAERMLTDDDDALTRLEVLETVARVLTKSKKDDDAKKYGVQVERLEARDYAEYAKANPGFKIEPYKGRKAKADRVHLVEIFASSEAVQSAAFQLAADGLRKAYTPADVLVVQYHMHVPGGADPLANRSTQDRVQFYSQAVQRGVFSFVNGKKAVQLMRDTNAESAKPVYDALREKLDEELEKPAVGKLTLAVTPAEKGFTVKATVTDVEKPGDQTMLRFLLVEDRVRYTGGNGVRYHQNVVRAMPGGKGFPVPKASAEHTVTVNPGDVREALMKYLEDAGKELDFPRSERPLALKKLKVIAFVQNDTSGEVLAAAQINLE